MEIGQAKKLLLGIFALLLSGVSIARQGEQPDHACPVSPLGRSLVQEVLSVVLRDALFVANQSHDRERGFALSLIGVNQAYLGVAFLVEDCRAAVLFEPFCEFANTPRGEPIPLFWATHDRCLRLGCEATGIDFLQVYMTMRPRTAPEDRHPFIYETTAPVGRARYDPNPSIVWRIDNRVATEMRVNATIENRLTITPAVGDPIGLVHTGTVAVVTAPNAISSTMVDLQFPTLTSNTAPVVVVFKLANGTGIGTVSLGTQKLATITGSLGSRPVFTWEPECVD